MTHVPFRWTSAVRALCEGSGIGVREFAQCGIVQLVRLEPVELLKTHGERPPLVRVDPVAISVHRFIEMHPLNSHLENDDASTLR